MKKLLLLWHLLSGHCSMWGVSVIFASPLLWSMGLIFFFFFRRTRFASWVPLAERMYNPPCMWKVQPHTFMNLPQKTVRFLGRGGDRWRGVYSRFLLVGLLQGFRLSAVTDGSNPHSHINGKSEDFMEANKRLPPGREPAGAPFSSTATLMAWQSSDLWIAYQQTSLSLSPSLFVTMLAVSPWVLQSNMRLLFAWPPLIKSDKDLSPFHCALWSHSIR